MAYAVPVWGSVCQMDLFKSLERQHCRAAKIMFAFASDKPTADVLATDKWDTLTHQCKLSLNKLIFTKVTMECFHAL